MWHRDAKRDSKIGRRQTFIFHMAWDVLYSRTGIMVSINKNQIRIFFVKNKEQINLTSSSISHISLYTGLQYCSVIVLVVT